MRLHVIDQLKFQVKAIYYRISRILITSGFLLLLVIPGQTYADMNWLEKESSFANGRIEGQIGEHLVVTDNDGDVMIINALDGSLAFKFNLYKSGTVAKVSAAPQSNYGLIRLKLNSSDKNTGYIDYLYIDGSGVAEANSFDGELNGLYKESDSPAIERSKDNLLVSAVNSNGDVVLKSANFGSQVLLTSFLKPENHTRTLQYLSTRPDEYVECIGDNAEQVVVKQYSPDRKIQSMSVGRINDEGVIDITHTFSLDKSAFEAMIQCFGSGAQFNVVIDAYLDEMVEIKNLPARVYTSQNEGAPVRGTTLTGNSNVVRVLFDGVNEIVAPGYYLHDKDRQRNYPTPVSEGVFIDTGPKDGESVLSTMDYKVATALSGLPRAVIEYPHHDELKRRYCVFDQRDEKVEKSCYIASKK